MQPSIDTKEPEAVKSAVLAIYRELFPTGNPGAIDKAFSWAIQCFTGHYDDFQPIDAHYHDLEHTLQGTLCMARLLKGRHLAKAEPIVTQRMFELGILAILLHDTGYLKKKSDTVGTGAKYTMVHVARSAELAANLLRKFNFEETEIKAVQHMIRCTGLNVDLKSIPFQSNLERHLGFCLGTADLVGQMAAKDYIQKLPVLYSEFAECAQYNEGQMGGVFSSAEDLMRRTPGFWKSYVLPKIEQDFLGVYKYLSVLDPQGRNVYLENIKQNIDSLQRQLKVA